MSDNKVEQEDVADYSGYFKNGDSPAQNSEVVQSSPLQEIPYTPKFTKKAKILILVLVVLLGLQVYLMIAGQQIAQPSVPEGYRLVSPPNQPAHIERIK
jgi:hypothetical protein